MLTSDFVMGFICMGLVGLLYLLSEFIKIFRELITILREELNDD